MVVQFGLEGHRREVVPSSMVKYLLLQLKLAIVFFSVVVGVGGREPAMCICKLGKSLAAHCSLCCLYLLQCQAESAQVSHD